MLANEAVAALVALVTAAFADNPRLSRETLVYQGSWETSSLMRNLAAVDDVPNDSFIEWHSDSLGVFRPEGLRHVLPHYMIYSLRHPDSDVTERLVFHLSPEQTRDEYWQERLAVFSSVQKRAICDYVRFMQVALAGQHYDEHLIRALKVWECGSEPI
ncbi:MAG TPA: DUF6714 family protein [Vicinamibacterales bacterium]|jgi:hypothetical protein